MQHRQRNFEFLGKAWWDDKFLIPADTQKPFDLDDSLSGMILLYNKSSDGCYSTCSSSESGEYDVIFEYP